MAKRDLGLLRRSPSTLIFRILHAEARRSRVFAGRAHLSADAEDRFILLTGRSDKELIDRASKLGANNVIAKPFTMPVLREKIEQVVGKLK